MKIIILIEGLRKFLSSPKCGGVLKAHYSKGNGGDYGYYKCPHCNRFTYNTTIVNAKIYSLNPQRTGVAIKLEHAINVIRNMPEILSSGRVEHKILLLGSRVKKKSGHTLLLSG